MKTITPLFLLIIFCITIITAYPQKNGFNSFPDVLFPVQEDTNKVNVINSFCKKLIDKDNLEEAASYANIALDIGKKTAFLKGLGETYHLFATIYIRRDNCSLARKSILSALAIWQKLGEASKIGECHSMLAHTYSIEHDYDNALNYLSLASKATKQTGDNKSIALIYNRIAEMNYYKENYSEALWNWNEALRIYEQENDKQHIASSFRSIAEVFEVQGNIAIANGNKSSATQNFLLALKYYHLALKQWECNKDAMNITEAYLSVANIYLKIKNLPQARSCIERSLNLSLKNRSKKSLSNSYYYLSLVDSMQHDYKLALKHYKYYVLYRDSLLKQENDMKALEAKMQNEYQKREAINKAKYYEEKALATAQISNHRLVRNLSLFIMIIIMLSSSYIIHRYYSFKRLKEAQKLHDERQRISRELHDEMGSSLSGIVLYTYLVKDQVHTLQTEAAETSLTIIQQSANEMVENLDDLVWSVNPLQDSLKNLLQKLKEYTLQMSATKSIKVIENISGKVMNLKLSAESRHNIYLLFKEAINNAVKYSNATQIRLSAQALFNIIEFNIQDNGKGFDMAGVKRGNGLANMQKRADEIAATLSIRSAPHKGTTISLQYKIT